MPWWHSEVAQRGIDPSCAKPSPMTPSHHRTKVPLSPIARIVVPMHVLHHPPVIVVPIHAARHPPVTVDPIHVVKHIDPIHAARHPLVTVVRIHAVKRAVQILGRSRRMAPLASNHPSIAFAERNQPTRHNFLGDLLRFALSFFARPLRALAGFGNISLHHTRASGTSSRTADSRWSMLVPLSVSNYATL